MSDYQKLETATGYYFSDRSLLRQALTHPSYTAENARVTYDNQRLEFLGDAVLQLVVSDLLFQTHPDACEGLLSKMRSLLARETGLTQLARRLDLGSFIRVGRGEKKTNGHQRESTLADAMEALFGAIYLDGGFEAAKAVITRLYQETIEDLDQLALTSNPKGTLQEISQERFKILPFYEVLSVTGPDHEPRYEVRVTIADRIVATGTAGSRREAEQEAAQAALQLFELEINPAGPTASNGSGTGKEMESK